MPDSKASSSPARLLPIEGHDLRDPTERTLEQSRRDIASMRELVEAIIEGKMSAVDARLTGNDTAIQLLQKVADRQPELVKEAVTQLASVNAEKFTSIQTQFVERDIRQNALSLADKTAVAAALQAQKEQAGATNDSNTIAITKMENNFAALIKSGADQLQQLERTLNDKINDVKDRALASESKQSITDPSLAAALLGINKSVEELRTKSGQDMGHSRGMDDSWAKIAHIGMFLIALAAVIVAVIRH